MFKFQHCTFFTEGGCVTHTMGYQSRGVIIISFGCGPCGTKTVDCCVLCGERRSPCVISQVISGTGEFFYCPDGFEHQGFGWRCCGDRATGLFQKYISVINISRTLVSISLYSIVQSYTQRKPVLCLYDFVKYVFMRRK